MILHLTTEFHPNVTNSSGDMTSYQFFEMSAMCRVTNLHKKTTLCGENIFNKFKNLARYYDANVYTCLLYTSPSPRDS